jgi:ADP-heptose:LPS heptosyltransferase
MFRKKRKSKKALLRKTLVLKRRDIKVVDHPEGSGRYASRNNFLRVSNTEGTLCIIRSVGGIGDVLMMTPGIRAVKAKYPKLKITVAVDRHRVWDDSYYNLISNAPFIHQVIDARYVSRKKFDKIIDISAVCIPYEKKEIPSRNRIDLFARHLGINHMPDKVPFLKIEESEKSIAKKIIEDSKLSKKSKVIAFAPSSNEDKRSWDKKSCNSFIKKLLAKNQDLLIVLFDMHDCIDASLKERKNVLHCKKTTVREMAALIQQADLFVGPDSGPMHISGALKKESIVLFGSIPPDARINHYETHKGFRAEHLNCLGCWYSKCPYSVRCMKEIDVDLVVEEALNKVAHSDTSNI